MQRISGYYYDKKQEQQEFDFQIASKWEELYAHQAATILEVLSYRKADKHVVGASLLALLYDKNYHILSHLDAEELHSLLPTTNFLLETRPPVKNFYPTLKLNKKVCLAPADDLSNIGFGEWCFAYQAYHYFCLSKQEIYLDKLIAVLYRPANPGMTEDNPGFTGDMRQLFNDNLIITREKAVKDIEHRFKQAVLAWFSSALFNIMQDRKNVFPVNDEPDAEQAPAPEDANRTWFTVFRELIGPKWGTEYVLKHTNALWVLDALEEQQIALDAVKPH